MRVLVLCAATFVVGLLAGSIFWPESGAYRSRASQEILLRDERARHDPAAAPEYRAERDPAAPGAVREEEGRNADVRELTREATKELERATTTEQAQAVLAGTGTVTGTVRDPAGKPVPGVVVTAMTDAQPVSLSVARRRARQKPHLDRDLADVAQDAIQSELWRRYARVTATTGPSGRFKLDGLMDSGHTLTAYHASYDVQPLAQNRRRVVPDAVFDFLARPVVEVQVEVRMPDDTLAENAWLSWDGEHGRGGEAWLKEDGKVRLPAGDCTIKATTTLPDPMESEEVVRSAHDTGVLVLQLEGRRILTARLALPEGLVLPGTVEYRLRLVDREEIEPESLLKDQSQRHARSPSPGRAQWFDLEPGSYLIAAFLNKRRLIAHAIAEVGEAASEIELPMEAPERGTYVTVRLLGPDGGPVPGHSSFRIIPEGEKAQRVDALQLDDGAWIVFVDTFDDAASDNATMRVGTRDYGGAVEPFRLRGGGTLTFRFGKAAKLSLKIDNYADSGAKGAVFAALIGEIGADAWRLVKPDGSADLGSVQPGPYALQLFIRRQNRNWPIVQRRINLRAGDEEIRIPMPTLHELQVRWTARGRPRVTLVCNDERIGQLRRTGTLNGNRRATFTELAAGTYQIDCAGKRKTVQVPSPEEVTLP